MSRPLILLLTGLLAAPLAWSHAKPQQQSPAPESTVASPAEIRLVFNENIEPAFSMHSVANAKGESVTAAKAAVDDATHRTLTLPLPALTPGMYVVKWAAVGPDGHRVKGSYSFTVK